MGEGIVRLLNADPFGEQISLKNFGDAEADISDYFFCLGPGQYNALSDYSNVDGDLSLAPDETVTFDLTSGSQNVTALPDDEAALALFAIGGNFGSSDPEILLDFLQYGNPNQNRVDQAVTAGRWTSEEDFVDGVGPFNYIGGAQDIGPDFWEAQGDNNDDIRVVRFQLTDAKRNVLIADLTDGAIINLNDFDTDRFNIEAITDPSEVGSVTFELSGERRLRRTENVVPYELFGNFANRIAEGDYTLTATPFSERNGRGEEGTALSISFEVVDEGDEIQVARFQLTDNRRNVLIADLTDGTVINLNDFDTDRFNIEAITDPSDVGSVTFELSGERRLRRTENVVPYELFGTIASRIAKGSYTLTATPFSRRNARGEKGTSLTISFEVVDEGDNEDEIRVARFQLTGEKGNVLIDEIQEGAVIDIAAFETEVFNIEAITDPSEVGSVLFNLQGPRNLRRTENVVPYELFGNNPAVIRPGKYELTATPFTRPRTGGEEGESLTIRFEIIDSNDNLLSEDPSAEAKLSLTVFPNPAQHQLTCKVTGESKGRMIIQVLNTYGMPIWSKIMEKNWETAEYPITLQGAPEGLYYIKVIMDGEETMQRLIIAN